MDLLLKTLKISALLLFIFVIVVLCAPTPKGGAFVIIHFVTTLRPWLFFQAMFLAIGSLLKMPGSRQSKTSFKTSLQFVLHDLHMMPRLTLRC